MSFEGFFKTATGQRPYAYQTRLAEQPWPEALIAPTGLGKTAAVILSWLWKRTTQPETTPRRLVYCLPMRTLVEQTAENATRWLEKLKGKFEHLPLPEDLHLLMGGVEKVCGEEQWYEKADRPAILIGTQDMLISRALMRGYASSRTRWPMEFGLLHTDSQWVFDEVQLMGAARATSAQLQAFRESLPAGLERPATSLWVSATLKPDWLNTVDYTRQAETLNVPAGVPEDEASDSVRKLIDASKPLKKADPVSLTGTKKGDIENYIRSLASFVLEKKAADGCTLVIVNTVERAQKLFAALQKAGAEKERPLVLIHSRFRPVDRAEKMEALKTSENAIVVATQAIEAGVDISSAAMVTELAPWPSLVQRFGRVNRYGECAETPVHWVDVPDEFLKDFPSPYDESVLIQARDRLVAHDNARPSELGDPGDVDPPRRVIRRKDLIDLFDTDPDLTGFDVDISPYVRDSDDTDVQVFWRDIASLQKEARDLIAQDRQPKAVTPSREELCSVSIGKAQQWVLALRKKKPGALIFASDPQWSATEIAANHQSASPPGWRRFSERPWPGMTLLVDVSAGGYDEERGFLEDIETEVTALTPPEQDISQSDASSEGDPNSSATNIAPLNQKPRAVTLTEHTKNVVAEAEKLAATFKLGATERTALGRAARWHDVGKAHGVFQDTMKKGLGKDAPAPAGLLAKTVGNNRHSRPYFRHELASALAFLTHEEWSTDNDLIAYLIASHHGKVRMSLRALPAERAPDNDQTGQRFARGIWEGDMLPEVDLGDGEAWKGGELLLNVMELGYDDTTHESWTERAQTLLERHGPFRLAFLEALLTTADWRASKQEQEEEKQP